METRGRVAKTDKNCHRNFRMYDYNPATIICLCCGKIRPLSDLKTKEIETVKMIESGKIKDFEKYDYDEGPNGWLVLREVQSV